MSEADLLLQKILEAGDVVGRDAAGRTVIQFAVDREDLLRLMAFGADAAESEAGDDEPDDVPPVSACWLDAGPLWPKHSAALWGRYAEVGAQFGRHHRWLGRFSICAPLSPPWRPGLRRPANDHASP
jgi:hypothetical protein